MKAEQFHRVSKALSDPQRFAILERLCASRETACQELVESFTVTQATISHHMKELHHAGLIKSRRDGKCMHFAVVRRVLSAYQNELAVRFAVKRVGSRQKSTKKKSVA